MYPCYRAKWKYVVSLERLWIGTVYIIDDIYVM